MTVHNSYKNFTVKGSVVRISLRNFMTYVNETFWPGPNFNVVVGANGSGKSSIVTALCIGLGGDLSYLNRQTDISSLVNNYSGSNEAQIEVELFIPQEDNLIVQCVLFNNNKPTLFKLNGKKVSKNELLKLTDDLQIQPGNMCQFLPQDVVRDFPTMNNQDIFYNTVKAVGDMSLINTYDKLKDIQVSIEKLDEHVETKTNTFANLERKEKKLDADRQIYEQRKKIEIRKNVIENAIKWEKFRTLRKRVKETRDRERTLKNRIDKLEAEEKPLKQFLENYEAKVNAQKEQIEKADKEYNLCCSKVEEFDISEMEECLERLIEQEKDLTQQESTRVQRRNEVSQEIKVLEEYFSKVALDPNLDEKIAEFVKKRSNNETNLQRSEQSLSELDFQQKNFEREKVKLVKAQSELQDVKNRKLITLERENPDAYKGVKWLNDNRHLFKAPIHEPIMLSLDVKDKALARYVETHIGKADLEGFVCENPDDVNKLTKQLRETMRLRKINAFHSNPDPPSRFQHPLPRNELEKFAVIDYISDMYSAPDAVHAYLCRQKGLHQVPVFREENAFSGQLKTKFHNYYIGNQKFNTRRSKYSGELSTGMEDIAGRRVVRLDVVVDSHEMERVTQELETKNKAIINNSARLVNIKRTCDVLKEKIGELNVEINKLRTIKKEFSSKQSELDMKRRTLLQLNAPKVDINSRKAEIKADKARAVRKLIEQTKIHQDLTNKSIEVESKRRILHLSFQNIESENSDTGEKLAALTRELDAVRAQFDEISVIWQRDKKNLQERHSEARKATGVLSEEVKYKPPEDWQRKFDDLNTNDEAVLSAYLDECDSELKHLKKIPDQTIADIETLKEKLEVARDEKESLEKEIANKRHEAKKLKLKWIRGVEELVENVNDKFGSMMADLGYNGQICLSQGNDDIDFSSYGIKIQVLITRTLTFWISKILQLCGNR